MNDSDLILEIEAQRDIMTQVATGKLRIQAVNDEYKQRRVVILGELDQRGLEDPNPFTDLWKWYGKWKEDLPTYQSRREFLFDLYDPLIEKIQSPPSVIKYPDALITLIDELENFELRYQTYVTEVNYTHLIDSVLHAKIKALYAYAQQFGFDRSIKLLDEIEMDPGNAVMILETLRSFVLPDFRVKLSEHPLSIPVQKVAFDLRKNLSKIKDEETLDFLEEAIICFEHGLHRAAVVMSWVGAVSLLHDYVIQNCLTQFNNEAARRNSKWKNAKSKDDLALMKEFDFLNILVALSVIGKNVKQELEKCLQLRNGCGHPNSLKIGQNKVAAHIETLILNVFAKFS